MTVLSTERAVIDAPAPEQADAQATTEVSAHPRLERRRQRRRHRAEAALAILVLPLAVALTLIMLLTASSENVLPVEGVSATPTVRVEGSLPAIAADRLVGAGIALDVTSAAAEIERTEIVYFASSDRGRAEALAEQIGADVVVLGTSRPVGVTFLIRVGEDLNS